MAFRVNVLSDAAAWTSLEDLLKTNQTNTLITPTLIRHLRELNAASVLIEEDYIDRDFSDAYSAYYAKTFRRHSKLCRRLLFFASDVSFLNAIGDVKQAAEQLTSAAYLGQIVLRPISQAPLSHAILAVPPVPPNYEGHLLVRGVYSSHVFGADLKVEGVPMTQQDSRVGACAQATIWVAARHFHTRHRGPWLSTVSITKAAIANSEHAINRSLPAGSEFLTGNNMVAALRAAGREPLIYVAPSSDPVTQKPVWGSLRPVDIINRYVDSGIPVIVGLTFPNQSVGHAVIATGQVLRETPRGALPKRPTRAEYCEAFYVNDDQTGPNIRVAISPGSAVSEAHYNVEDNVQHLMIPLPDKVYLPAETAEVIAWNCINNYAQDWPAFKARHAGKLGTSEAMGDDLAAKLQANEVIARTYLTYGWKYKHRGIRNRFSNPERQVIRNLEVPRFVYVTEFTTTNLVTAKPKYERRILSHCVIDATAKHQDMDSVLLMHAPGFCSWQSQDKAGKVQQKVAPVKDATSYYPKVRGQTEFTLFENTAA